MGDYPYRVLNALLGSELLPAFLRLRLMRRAGFNISKEACIWPGASFRSRRVTIGSGVFINVGFVVRPWMSGFAFISSMAARSAPSAKILILVASVGIGDPPG